MFVFILNMFIIQVKRSFKTNANMITCCKSKNREIENTTFFLANCGKQWMKEISNFRFHLLLGWIGWGNKYDVIMQQAVLHSISELWIASWWLTQDSVKKCVDILDEQFEISLTIIHARNRVYKNFRKCHLIDLINKITRKPLHFSLVSSQNLSNIRSNDDLLNIFT